MPARPSARLTSAVRPRNLPAVRQRSRDSETTPPVEPTAAPDDAKASSMERLLDTASALFRSRGYGSATTRELSQLLGIKKASLYHYIDGKEELLYAICVQSLRSIYEHVNATAEATPPEHRLRAMIQRHVVAALTDRDMHTVMLVELRNLSPEHMSDVVERRDKYESLLRNAISAEQYSGRLRTDYQAKYLTLALLNLLNWTIFWYDPDGEVTPDELGELLADVFLHGAECRDDGASSTQRRVSPSQSSVGVAADKPSRAST